MLHAVWISKKALKSHQKQYRLDKYQEAMRIKKVNVLVKVIRNRKNHKKKEGLIFNEYNYIYYFATIKNSPSGVCYIN